MSSTHEDEDICALQHYHSSGEVSSSFGKEASVLHVSIPDNFFAVRVTMS
jgi:hypothetical protein